MKQQLVTIPQLWGDDIQSFLFPTQNFGMFLLLLTDWRHWRP